MTSQNLGNLTHFEPRILVQINKIRSLKKKMMKLHKPCLELCFKTKMDPTLANTILVCLQATLLELHRRCNVIPCAIPHATTEDVELEDFILPKGTTVMANLYSSHMDPEYWQEPDRFDPTRFLDTNGQLINHESYMPFSIGKITLGRDHRHIITPRFFMGAFV